MRAVRFDPAAWDDFQYWLGSDRKAARRITRLIADDHEVRILKARYHY